MYATFDELTSSNFGVPFESSRKRSLRSYMNKKESHSSAKKPRKHSKKIAKKYCCYPGCKSNNVTVKLQCLPRFPDALKEDATIQKRKTHCKKVFIRREWTDRLGYGRGKADYKDLRICTKHSMEEIKKSISYQMPIEGGSGFKTTSFTATFKVPVPAGTMNESGCTESNGIGLERS